MGVRKGAGQASSKGQTGTETSAFGSPGRICHDSSKFYGSRLYQGLSSADTKLKCSENCLPADKVDKIFARSSEQMEDLPDCCVHLMVTSPPYNVGKEYDEDLTLQEYRDFLSRVWKETYRVLVPGGRACINVANLGRKPYLSLSSLITGDMLDTGFLMRGEIIWNKASSASPSTAWGSWQSASNPTLRDVHEYILVFSKDSFARAGKGRTSTITRDEFLEYTKSVWTFGAESARKIGHPAPFPTELPARCIKLYTFEGDVVLDPFMGSGTTAVAALQNGRHFVGYEIDPEYIEKAEARIAACRRPTE
ncbi:DNA-methyltransferase [Methanocella sp. MCL-LM]|uniref:DNA-methyltransferase n=1 Tax=Methanocella sp. MCL-LM TaxID=3412035 RepID=UPI003C72DB4E